MDTHKLAKETNEFQNERKSLSLDSGSFFLQFQQIEGSRLTEEQTEMIFETNSL